MFNLFLSVVRRDLMLALRQKSDLVQTIFFFAVVVTLVPLGVGAEQNVLRTMAPGVVWVAALLAALLSLPRIFALDYADGTLEQMLISAEPLSVIVVGKVVAHTGSSPGFRSRFLRPFSVFCLTSRLIRRRC